MLLVSSVSRVRITSVLNSTIMSSSETLKTSLLKVKISSKNERGCICDLSDFTLQIIFDVWWAAMNIGSKPPIARNDSRHASSWQFHLPCRIEEPGCQGIICIVCHQVLRHPSGHGTSSMGKQLPAKAHIAKLNKLTEREVTELTSSTVFETAWAILKQQRRRGILIVSSLRKFRFDIQAKPYWPKWQTKRSKLAANDFETSESHQHTWHHYLKLGFVLAHIPWNAISNVELRLSYGVLRSDLVLRSAKILGNICRRDNALTMDAIKK